MTPSHGRHTPPVVPTLDVYKRQHIHQFVEKPTISILLPTLNSSERGLRTAIYSVLAQLYPHWELCVAVDASFDKDVRGVVEECARLDARIRVFYHASNVLNSNVLNGALKLARGQFVGLLEDDDVFAEDAPVSYTHLDVYKRQGDGFAC